MTELKQRFRFLILLVCMVMLIITLPLMDDHELTNIIITAAYSALLFITVYVLSESKQFLIIGFIFAIPYLLISWNLIHLSNMVTTLNIKFTSQLFVNSFVIIFLLNHIFNASKVTVNIIYAAVCVYLLLGVVWSNAYTMLELNFPGSFSGLDQIYQQINTQELELSISKFSSNFMYFSYITLTTLGYGNIYPVTLAANALASTEAITGQLFLTILIGRLIGMHIAQIRS